VADSGIDGKQHTGHVMDTQKTKAVFHLEAVEVERLLGEVHRGFSS
jgi:hypothetical protein